MEAMTDAGLLLGFVACVAALVAAAVVLVERALLACCLLKAGSRGFWKWVELTVWGMLAAALSAVLCWWANAG